MRALILGALVALVGCGPRTREPAEPRPAAPEASATAKASRPTVSGSLRAHDGSAITHGRYAIGRQGFVAMTAEGDLARDGSFRVELDPGLYAVTIAAVDHAQVRRVVLVEGDIEVSGTLGTYTRAEPGTTLQVRGEFFDAEGKSLGRTPTAATRASDGRFRLELGTVPATATQVRHQITVGGGRTANGPGGQSFVYDGGGDYWAVVDLPKDGVLVLDPRGLPPAGIAQALDWRGEDPTTVALHERLTRWEGERRRIIESMPRKDGKILVATAETKAAMTRLSDEARADAERQSDERLRVLLHALAFTTFAESMQPERAREELRWFVEHVPVDDPRLGLTMGLVNAFFTGLQGADATLSAAADAWLDRFALEQPEAGVAIGALHMLLFQAEERGDDARIAELYAQVESPRFAGTWDHAHLAKQYAPDRVLRRGNTLPDFDFAALGDPKARITKSDRVGKLYVVELWATWCGPCVAEMPELHETYKAINGARLGKGKGDKALRKLRAVTKPRVEFVFLSLDGKEETVAAFRREHWSMPWTHAFVGGGIEAEVMKRFGAPGVPTTILVDEHGKILEYGRAMRKDQLRGTLERALANAANAAQ